MATGSAASSYVTPPLAGAPAHQVDVVAIGKTRVEILGQARESKDLCQTQVALDNPSKPIT